MGTDIEEFLSLSINNQQQLYTSKNLDVNEQHLPINIRQIIEVKSFISFFVIISFLFQCMDIVCYLCLQHTDHNVVSSSLETLEIILKYSNLFDFDQLLISTEINSIEETRVSERLRTNSSVYQRSFIDINEKPLLTNKISDETDSNSNTEKRTSAAKLVQQLISKY